MAYFSRIIAGVTAMYSEHFRVSHEERRNFNGAQAWFDWPPPRETTLFAWHCSPNCIHQRCERRRFPSPGEETHRQTAGVSALPIPPHCGDPGGEIHFGSDGYFHWHRRERSQLPVVQRPWPQGLAD